LHRQSFKRKANAGQRHNLAVARIRTRDQRVNEKRYVRGLDEFIDAELLEQCVDVCDRNAIVDHRSPTRAILGMRHARAFS